MVRKYVFLGAVLVLASRSAAESDDTTLLQKSRPPNSSHPPNSTLEIAGGGRMQSADEPLSPNVGRAYGEPNKINRVAWMNNWRAENHVPSGMGLDMKNVHLQGINDGTFPQWKRMVKALKVEWSTGGPNVTNRYTLDDLDGDGTINAEDGDMDGDWIMNTQDAFPKNVFEQYDADSDGIGNNMENAPLQDVDGDGIRNKWDLDVDGDRIPNIVDDLDYNAQAWQDTDNDNVGDQQDAFPDNPLEYQDLNGNEKLDRNEYDMDQDGIDHERGVNAKEHYKDLHLPGLECRGRAC